MERRTAALLEYLNGSHSAYHGIALLKKALEQAGFCRLEEEAAWDLAPGGNYYLIRNGSSLLAFRIPRETPQGFLISASHSDRPGLKVKENAEQPGYYTRLAVERYGGMLIAPWLDRPLSVAGRVLVETETGTESRLVDIDRDLLLIPNVAIHMNRQANEGYVWNLAVDTQPLLGGKETAGKLWALLEQTAGGKILGHDLYLYVRQKADVWGIQEEFLSAQGLDDLECAWCCTQGFLHAQVGGSLPVLCVFDSEEVGSCTAQGADSELLEGTLERICTGLGLDRRRMLAQSFMVSADNAHAVHPNHPEYADPGNAPVLNGGIVLKFNAGQRYTTDGLSAALFRRVCALAQVPVQTYFNRPDIPGGYTLGRISLNHVSIPTADVGLPQLAMHSCYETAGVRDAEYLEQAMTAYYSCTLLRRGDRVDLLPGETGKD